MALGHAPDSEDLFRSAAIFCGDQLEPTSIYRLLHDSCHRLFPDEAFADLYQRTGRRSIPPRVVAVVMVLQRLEGLSDREAVERFRFDMRWKYAAGVPLDYPGFVHTVLVDMRMRLRRSARPNRIFEAVLEVAKRAGLVGRRRVIDSTALYDAVATMDTVTMIRSALRQLLKVAPAEQERRIRAVLRRNDDYVRAGKPVCDWDDAQARAELIDALARDGYAALEALEGQALSTDVAQAAELLATVLGQDLEPGEDGRLRIACKVAADRVISTVDPESRHGRKTSSRKFDGYKGHVAIDPDSEVITSTAVTAANVGDAEVAKQLVADVWQADESSTVGEDEASEPCMRRDQEQGVAPSDSMQPEHATRQGESTGGQTTQTANAPEAAPQVDEGPTHCATAPSSQAGHAADSTAVVAPKDPPVEIYGDSSYGRPEFIEAIEVRGGKAYTKVQQPSSRQGCFAKSAFEVDVDNGTVTCPARVTVAIRKHSDGSGRALFGQHCARCPLRPQCTRTSRGRIVTVHPHEKTLQRVRAEQATQAWREKYRSTRPKVERKIAHMMRRHHGGRCARLRGRQAVEWDFSLLAAAINLRRLAQLGVEVKQCMAQGLPRA